MPALTKATARSVERRADILRAATELFIESGYAGASTDAIVRRSGGSKETVYSLFGSKEGLFRAVIESYATISVRAIDIAALDPSEPATALRKIGIAFLTTLASRESVDMLRLIIAETDRVPDARETFLRSGPETSRRDVAAFLGRCEERGSLHVPDALLYAQVFNAMITEPLLAVVLRRKPPSSREITSHVNRMLPLFLMMCGARRASP